VRSLRGGLWLSAALVAGACSSSADPSGSTRVPSNGADPVDGSTPHGDAGAVTATDSATPTPEAGPLDAAVEAGPPSSSLPVSYSRADVGTPLSASELAAATDELIAILKDTRYFDVVDERIHGWPESDPNHGFWYGSWWSGVHVLKSGGQVTYSHTKGGSDNNGLRTAPYLEGACYANLLWGEAKTAKLVQRMVRGYSSWALAMVRFAGDTNPTMLARAHYPVNVVSNDGGRQITIDYSANRPGEDNGATEYVHITNNPTFGDIWVKNKRSKDDMGHIFRSMIQIEPCASRLDAAGQADVQQMKDLYAAWSRSVEANGWGIASLDKDGNMFTPPLNETLAHYTLLGNVECTGPLAFRFSGDGDPGSLDCGSGISSPEKLASSALKNDARQILRTHHEAAVNWAYYRGATGPALSLLQGLAERVETDIAIADQASPPANFNPTDVAALILHAANAGVPLTSREVRWIHGRLHTAAQTLLNPAAALAYRVFDPQTPDGEYPYEPGSDGLFFSDIGVLLGSCASEYRNPTTRPLLDCARLQAAF
jgi:hypothetical protein